MAKYRTIRIYKGNAGFSGPLTITPTIKKIKLFILPAVAPNLKL